MEGLLKSIEPLLSQYGYAALFVMVFLDTLGVPSPGGLAILAAGIFAARGDMNAGVVFLCAWGAAVAGDNFGYFVGRFGGRKVVVRYGRFVGIRHERLEFLEHLYGRFGMWIVCAARFFSILRQLNGLAAGVVLVSWRRFLLAEMLGAALWSGGWTVAAYFFGSQAVPLLGVWGAVTAVVIGLFVIGIVAAVVLRKLRAMEHQHRARLK